MDKQICFLYTETNGLHQTNEEISKKNLFCFARLVTINYIIGYYKDSKFVQVKKIRQIVKPRCMIIPPETTKYHGITQEIAVKHGSEIEEILTTFKTNLKPVDIIISHNIDFHLKTILSEGIKYNIAFDFNNKIIIDTISFYHNYGFLKLKDLANKLKITDICKTNENNVELIKNIFLKLYVQYYQSIKTS